MDPSLRSLQRSHLRPEAADPFRFFDRRFARPAPRPSLSSQVSLGAIELRVESLMLPINVALMGSGKGIQLFAFIVVFATGLAGCASTNRVGETPGVDKTITGATKWGHYDCEPVAKWNPDGRTMTLLSELRYTDPHGEVWVAPIGSVVDGASIPRYLWSVMGGPFEGKYRNGSVLHDVAYGEHNRPWQDCDRMFYYAMRCSGVSAAESKTMYYALYKFGHHWNFPIKRGKPVKYKGELVTRGEQIPRAIPVNPEQINEARDWISNT